MSRQQRLGLVAVAVAVAVVAFLVARPGDDESKPAQQAGTAPAQTTGSTTTEAPAAAAPQPAVTRIRVRGGKPVGGVKEIRVKTGETVRIVVTSDTPQELHLHGYDIVENAAPGSPARFRFKAKLEGIFELELEGPHVQVAELRVEP